MRFKSGFENIGMRKGRIRVSYDVLKEIFEKINGEYIGKKIEILSIYYDAKDRSYYAECYSEEFPLIELGTKVPVIYELDSRKDITPTDAFRRSRKIGKAINESQIVKIEKKIIPKKKKIK